MTDAGAQRGGGGAPLRSRGAPGVYCVAGSHEKCRLGAARCGCECHRKGAPIMPKPGSSMSRAAGDVEMTWEDPPPGGRGSEQFAALLVELGPQLAQLRSNPGKWARLASFTKKTAASTTKTKLGKRTDMVDIEFAARSFPDNTSALWGRCDPARV